MKTCKNYRFSPRTIEAIKKLKEMYPTWTETEIVEAAIQKELESYKTVLMEV